MENAYTKIVTTLVRAGFMWLMGALASHLSPAAYDLANNIITQLGGQDTVILGIAGTLGAVMLSVWIRLKSQIHIRTALDLPKGSSIADVKANSPGLLAILKDPQPK